MAPSPRRKKTDRAPTASSSPRRKAVMVTPSSIDERQEEASEQSPETQTTTNPRARRALFGRSPRSSAVTPSPSQKKRKASTDDEGETTAVQTTTTKPLAKRRLLFGRYVASIECAPNVQAVYKIVRKLTGNIGGNGYSGPIYGELTMHSMQKMINLMMETTGLSKESRFIDVGSGIGKPNLHVAQYPGVAFSCGVEMEHTRWALGMTCLKACVDAAVEQRRSSDSALQSSDTLIQGNTVFLHKNITEAKTFDPFTHVYMFSIGFPPELWLDLAEQWNTSDPNTCKYLICYHAPKDIIDCYEFDVELVAQTQTSMHGSKEGHMGYIYRRTTNIGSSSSRAIVVTDEEAPSPRRRNRPLRISADIACDPIYERSFKLVQEGLEPLQREVNREMNDLMGGTGRTTRSRQRQRLTRY